MVSQQHILSKELVLLIPPCLIVGLFLSKRQVYVTLLKIAYFHGRWRAVGTWVAPLKQNTVCST